MVSNRTGRKKIKGSKRGGKRGGRGILNTIIDNLPISLHVPGYSYCGPGTNLATAGKPVNKLDAHCREHDIFYSQHHDTESRNKADMKLAEQAWERVKASDSSLGERAAAYAITNAMKAKVKLGMGMKNKVKKNGQFPVVKASAKGTPLQRRVHAKRVKNTKTKRKRNTKSRY